jgi:hypothetical protein
MSLCGSQGKLFTQSGLKTLGYPYGSYSANSPIRPLCYACNTLMKSQIEVGDLRITLSKNSFLELSGWNQIDRIPSIQGFTAIKFAPLNTTHGLLENVLTIKVSEDCLVTLTTPQLSADWFSPSFTEKDFGVLKLGSESGDFFITLNHYSASGPNINRLTVQLPGSGDYLFGFLNNEENTVLPALYGQGMKYLGLWKKKKFSYGSLIVQAMGPLDISFRISEATQDFNNEIVYAVYDVFVGELTNGQSLTLTQKLPEGREGYVWM